MKRYVPIIITGIVFFVAGILASPLVLRSTSENTVSQTENKLEVSKKQPQNKIEAFEECVTEDVLNLVKIITMPESEKQQHKDSQLPLGVCNGNYAQPLCEAGINFISTELAEPLTSCMDKHLY